MAHSSLTTPIFTLDMQLLFSHEDSSFQMFSSKAYGQKNLLFKDSTLELVPIATQNYEAWLGQEYLHAMKGLLCDPNRESSCACPCQPPSLPGHNMAGFSTRLARAGHLSRQSDVCPVAPGEPVTFSASSWSFGVEAIL